MGRKNSVGTANGLPNGERAGGAAAGSGAPVPCHLLVMRTSAMGDVAMLPHALRALTAAYPDLRVTVATQAMFRPFFAGLDVGFLDVDVKGAHHSLAGMWRLASHARRLGVDAVADVLMGHVACKFRKIGVNDQFGQSGKAADVLREYGLTADQIADRIRETL